MSVQSFDHDSRRLHLPARLADRSHLLPATSSEQAGGGAAATFAESPDAEKISHLLWPPARAEMRPLATTGR